MCTAIHAYLQCRLSTGKAVTVITATAFSDSPPIPSGADNDVFAFGVGSRQQGSRLNVARMFL